MHVGLDEGAERDAADRRSHPVEHQRTQRRRLGNRGGVSAAQRAWAGYRLLR